MPPEARIIVVILDPKLCKGIKEPFINKQGKAEVYLADKTTQQDALDGNTIYKLSGKSGIIITGERFEQIRNEVESYLTSRFGNGWSLELRQINRK